MSTKKSQPPQKPTTNFVGVAMNQSFPATGSHLRPTRQSNAGWAALADSFARKREFPGEN